MKFRPHIYVSILYNPELRKEDIKFDIKLERIASKLGGDLSGSGYGLGKRDVNFMFYNLADAKEFYTFIKRFKNVEISSSCVLNENDY